MNRNDTILLLLGGGVLAYWVFNQNQFASATDTLASNAESLFMGWKNAGSGPTWVPYLNAAENTYGLPVDMLARQAYQESDFIEAVIRGTRPSSAGALGILQMMPQYFNSVTVPKPFTDQDVLAQIDQAAQQMVSLFRSTQSWPLALAAYNAGLGTVEKYGGIPPFAETQNYVAKILADVPGLA